MGSLAVRAVNLEYLGGDVITLVGASIQVVTMPRNCSTYQLKARGGDVYYEMNGAAASANSPGYAAQNTGAFEGPLTGLTRLDVYGAQGAIAHITFYREHVA